MNQEFVPRLPQICHYGCLSKGKLESKLNVIVRNGEYRRKSDGKVSFRFLCRNCGRSFSTATRSCYYRMKRRNLAPEVRRGLASCVSLRRLAINLGAHRTTIVRYGRFLGRQAVKRIEERHEQIQKKENPKIHEIYFDEMETFERSKCLPLSLALIVEPKRREILGFSVASMPAKGPLAAISRKRYGFRKDERKKKSIELFKKIKDSLTETVTILSDENPKYPNWIKKEFPNATHKTTKGRRGCVVGQGELKRGGFDELFALNHTAAMIRANVNRLVRRTWCTTKKPDRLYEHLAIYAEFHNRVLI